MVGGLTQFWAERPERARRKGIPGAPFPVQPTYPEGTTQPSAQLPAEIEIGGQLISVTWSSERVVVGTGADAHYVDIFYPLLPISANVQQLFPEILLNYVYERKDVWGEDAEGKAVIVGQKYEFVSDATAAAIDTDILTQGMNFLSLASEYQRRYNAAPSGDVENYLLQIADKMMTKKVEIDETTWNELGLLRRFPSYTETLRRQGKLPPLTPAEEKVRLEAEATTRRGMEYAFQPEGTFQSEKAQAEDTLRRLKPMYEQYKQQLEQGVVSEQAPGTVEQQLGVAGVRGYESAQQKLADIESGKVKGWQYEGSNLEAETKAKEQAIETDWQRLRGQAKRQRIAERFTKI